MSKQPDEQGPDEQGPDEQRAALAEMWERAAPGWGRRAQRIREWGMPVSVAMIDAASPQPGETVLELAAGPGDTGFLAAEIVGPAGRLISSDGAEGMLSVARARAQQLGISNVEFRQLQIEWIDLETASVDVVLCRWGLMFALDPAAALHEVRRVLRPGGRSAVAVWAGRAENPWATITTRELLARSLIEPPPDAPGMFALADGERLSEMFEAAGFVEPRVQSVAVERRYASAEEYLEETLEVSPSLGPTLRQIGPKAEAEVRQGVGAAVEAYRASDGLIRLPGVSLVASAAA